MLLCVSNKHFVTPKRREHTNVSVTFKDANVTAHCMHDKFKHHVQWLNVLMAYGLHNFRGRHHAAHAVSATNCDGLGPLLGPPRDTVPFNHHRDRSS